MVEKKQAVDKPWDNVVACLPFDISLTESERKSYQRKVSQFFKQFDTDIAQYHFETFLHYVTFEDVKAGRLPHGRETEIAKDMYLKNPPLLNESFHMQDPSVTFQEDIQDDPCPKCGAQDTTMIPKQRRAPDEPMDYFAQCRKCGKTWTVRDGESGKKIQK